MNRIGPWLAIMVLVFPLSVTRSAGPSGRDSHGEAASYDKIIVVAVGIERYRNRGWPPLPNAAREARAFAEAMKAWGAKVVLVTGDATRSRESILKQIHAAGQSLPRRLPRTLLIVYYAGHAETYPTGGFGDAYIIPRDAPLDPAHRAEWLSMDAVRRASGQLGEFRHQLVLMATCFGGNIFKTHRSVWRSADWTRTARVAITAGNREERVYDGVAGAMSAFGRATVDALTPVHQPAADADSDGCITQAELGAHIQVNGQTPISTPQFGFLPRHDGGVIRLCRPGVEPRPPTAADGTPRNTPAPGGDEPSASAPRPPTAPAVSLPPGWVRIERGSMRINPGRGHSATPSRRSASTRLSIPHDLAVTRTEVTRADVARLRGHAGSTGGACSNCPATDLTWFDAVRFANAMSKREKRQQCYALAGCGSDARGRAVCRQARVVGPDCTGYRLPTEQEWEYIARRELPASSALSHFAWFGANSGHTAHPVGSLRSGRRGTVDLLGNAWEWTESKYDVEAGSGARMVVRGGSFASPVSAVRVNNRGAHPMKSSRPTIGFRLVRTLPGARHER